MIGILHGYLLEGSGSNLWTRSVVTSLCRRGETVHLFCQENHGDLYEFIGETRRYELDGSVETIWKRQSPFPGKCILHKPVLGDTLPVYVGDRYEEFPNVVPMIKLADKDIERYIETNVRVIARVVAEEHIQVLHANHIVLMPEVARRVKAQYGTPYVIMPHGSAIEYAVKKDQRFFRFAERSIAESAGLFVIGPEIRQRMNALFPDSPGLDQKMTDLNLGVDTSLFTTEVPQNREARVQELKIAISGTKRGRKACALEKFRNSITADISKERLTELLRKYADYDHKAPDEDVEDKWIPWTGPAMTSSYLSVVSLQAKGFKLWYALFLTCCGLAQRLAFLPLVTALSGKCWRLCSGPWRMAIDILPRESLNGGVSWRIGRLAPIPRFKRFGMDLEGNNWTSGLRRLKNISAWIRLSSRGI